MNNSIFYSLLIGCGLMLFGCSKNEDPSTRELLQGIWVNTSISNSLVPTDEKFVMEFVGNTEYYSTGVIFDPDNKKWFNRRAYDFSLVDDRILISGTNEQGNAIELEFGIISIDQDAMVCRVNRFTSDGVEVPDPGIYAFKKASRKFNDAIVGTWYGKSTYAGSTDTDFHYWNYLSDGTYVYYYRENPSSPWIKKIDNEGRYYVYDDLLATNWSNDLQSGVKGLAYECWEIDISGKTMKWTGYRPNGQITSYEMEKVAGPPPGLVEPDTFGKERR